MSDTLTSIFTRFPSNNVTEFGDDAVLYPGGALKEYEYYFLKKRAECDDSASRALPVHALETHHQRVRRAWCREARGRQTRRNPRRRRNWRSRQLGQTRQPRFARMSVRPLLEDAQIQRRDGGHRRGSQIRAGYVEDVFGVVTKTTVSASNVGCTSARSAGP